MENEAFLIDVIMDLHEVDARLEDDFTEEEYDAKFLNDDGEFMSDRDYIAGHKEEFNFDAFFDEVYATLISEDDDENYSFIGVVKELVHKYIVMSYQDKDSSTIIEYLRNTDIEEIGRFFDENIYFGRDLIKRFIEYISDNDKYEKNKKLIEEKKDNILERFESKTEIVSIESINEVYRKVIINLYNYFLQNGCNKEEVSRNIFAFFVRDFDPLGELDKIGMSYQDKMEAKAYILKLMYLDIYEDIKNDAIIKPENAQEYLFQTLPEIMVRQNISGIPSQEEVLGYFLEHFMLVHDNINKRKSNREKTISDGRLTLIRKYVPTCDFDVIDLYQ